MPSKIEKQRLQTEKLAVKQNSQASHNVAPDSLNQQQAPHRKKKFSENI